jgi:hypothetical protein
MNKRRKWFGPSKKEIWRQLGAEIGADYIPGSFWKREKVQAKHNEWIITLDTYAVSTGKATVVFTRLRAPYVNPGEFRFTIYRRGLFSGIAKRLGMQDVEVGHKSFDDDFIIKGTDEGKLRALFDNARLRELIAAQPRIHLTVKDGGGQWGSDFPPDTDELSFHVRGIIKDLARLKLLFELFAVTLDQLCRMGSAYERAPKPRTRS